MAQHVVIDSMSITDDIVRALRLRGATEDDLAVACGCFGIIANELELARHGLALAVVSAGRPTVQISSAQLVMAAIDRAIASGEPEKGLQARIARLCGLSQSQIARALPTDDRPGQELGAEARERLEAHLLDPVAHPLPDAKDWAWTRGLAKVHATGNGWGAPGNEERRKRVFIKQEKKTSRGEGEGA